MERSGLKGCFCSKEESGVNKIVIPNLIWNLQCLLLPFINNMRGRSRIKYGMTLLWNKGGFTLIELLVVVLIIGILAAVAVPQYQKAVIKSRYTNLKVLTRAIAEAEEMYYLANNKYAIDLDELDIEMPAYTEETKTDSLHRRYFDWGYCEVSTVTTTVTYTAFSCRDYSAEMGYVIYFQYAGKNKHCIARNTDLSSIQNQICKTETGKDAGYVNTESKYTDWVY